MEQSVGDSFKHPVTPALSSALDFGAHSVLESYRAHTVGVRVSGTIMNRVRFWVRVMVTFR